MARVPPPNRRFERRLTLALFGVAASTQSPSPVLLYYTDRLGLDAFDLTVFFAIYAIGLVPSLLLGGPYSDRYGRRTVVVPVSLLSVVALLVLVLADTAGQPALLVGRFLQGVTSGAVFTVGTVWMRELAGTQRAAAAAMRASAAMAVGFALGPFIAGALVQWAPWPAVLPFVLPLALVLLSFVLARSGPETMTLKRPGRLQIGVPPGAARGFWVYLLPAGLLVYSFAVLSLTVFPLLVARAGFTATLFLAGLMALIVQGSAALSTAWARRLGPGPSGWIAALLAAIGCGFGYLAVQPDSWPWVLPASLAIGVSEGLAITSGITVSDWLAPPHRRGGLVSVFYLVVYFGFLVPAILVLVSGEALFGGTPILALGACALVVAVVLALPGRRLVTRVAPAPAAASAGADRRTTSTS
ncbi:MFS transporter [soil metagenome]